MITLHNFFKLPKNGYLILFKMVLLIQLSIFQLCNKTLVFNLSITPFVLNKELYKIKTKFKSYLKKSILIFQNKTNK